MTTTEDILFLIHQDLKDIRDELYKLNNKW